MNGMREKLGSIFVDITDWLTGLYGLRFIDDVTSSIATSDNNQIIPTRTSGKVNPTDWIEYICTIRLRWKHGARVANSYVHLFKDDDYNRWVEYVPGPDPITSVAATDSGRLHFAYNVAIVPWLNDKWSNEDIQNYADEDHDEIDPEEVGFSPPERRKPSLAAVIDHKRRRLLRH